jgi:hypothetical protein
MFVDVRRDVVTASGVGMSVTPIDCCMVHEFALEGLCQRPIGRAVVCCDLLYAATYLWRWPAAEVLLAGTDLWQRVTSEVTSGLPLGARVVSSAIATLLVPLHCRETTSLRYLNQRVSMVALPDASSLIGV